MCCILNLNMDYKVCKIYQAETEAVIKDLRIADCMNFHHLEEDSQRNNDVPYNLKELVVSDVLTCSYCNVAFTDGLDQRNHYKLDWHRYNLKRALCGSKPVPEEIFDTLADDVSSISGSDGESSDGEDLDSDTDELEKTKQTENFRHRMKTIRHTKVFFENFENNVLSVYKCLLQGKKESLTKDELVNGIYELMKKPKKWMVIVLGGGHFASAIFNNDTITHHKTFHCYTVRAKQGGSQSARDNKGGSHPKSAGASLRRYNEHALVQHVQEIMAAWSEPLKQCSLILYRATGPYNRNVLFGGKNPPLCKTDHRLRNIPFPTRRATFNEVKRIHDMLSSVEIYGSAEFFRNKFPRSPDKRTRVCGSKTVIASDEKKEEFKSKDKSNFQKFEAKARESPQREIPGQNIKSDSESSSEDEQEYELLSSDVTISFQNLQEYDDNVADCIENFRNIKQERKKKRKKTSKRKKADIGRKMWNEEFERLRENLVKSCQNGDKELLIDNLNIYNTLPERGSVELGENEVIDSIFTKEDFINCLNDTTRDENRNTLLHLAAQKSLPEFVTELLSAGADPTIKNKNKLTPYVVSGDKETRNSFKLFASSFPNKYDFKRANIPEPLTKEEEKELEEKKKEKKKLKRMKEKIKKQEDKEKRDEEKEKERFLALSDREKCALAAERRLIASATANLKSSKPPVLSRCFQCGVDITGKVPFEYGVNRFCSIPCLKAHRAKTNNYGAKI